ncbi:MAG: tail fiber protein [Acidobacteriota bacterium]
MAEAYLGEIRIFAGDFQPRGWMYCRGQELEIAQHGDLFKLLKNTYGGDPDKGTFRLPDLQGRFAMHAGRGPRLSERRLGQAGGESEVRLTADQVPAHEHALRVSEDGGDSVSPTGRVLAANDGPAYAAKGADGRLAKEAVSSVGVGEPHQNRQPYLPINFIICLRGDEPRRD